MQADEQVCVGLTGDGDAAVEGDIGVAVPRQADPVTAGAFQLALQIERCGEGDGALTTIRPDGTRITATVTGVNENERTGGRAVGTTG